MLSSTAKDNEYGEQLASYDPETVCGILHGIAKNYPESSEEYKALELAAGAVIFVKGIEFKAEFEEFLRRFNQKLTKKQIEHLRSMGLME